MTQLVCERCGAVIECPKPRWNIMRKRVYFVQFGIMKNKSSWTDMTIDICDKCHDSFFEWLGKDGDNNA